MSSKFLAVTSNIIGILLVILAVIYFIYPAKSLPSFIPGYDPTLIRHHYTHAIGALVLGLLSFIFAWFQSGKKSSK